MVITKEQAREYFTEWLQKHRASGVPDAGIAEMFAHWMMGHIEMSVKEAGSSKLSLDHEPSCSLKIITYQVHCHGCSAFRKSTEGVEPR